MKPESHLVEINLGAIVCAKLKTIYFYEIEWIDCYKLVSAKFVDLLQIAKKFYADKSKIDTIKEIVKYSNNDIVELFAYGLSAA
jgi:hypothetical protein